MSYQRYYKYLDNTNIQKSRKTLWRQKKRATLESQKVLKYNETCFTVFSTLLSYCNKLKNRPLVNEVINKDILVLNHKYNFKQTDFAFNKNNSFSDIGYSETDTRNDDHLNRLFDKNEQTTTSNSQQGIKLR